MTGTRHVPPFFCPYCGEQDISPYGEQNGGWRCGSCVRAFELRTLPPGAAVDTQPPTSGSTADHSTVNQEVNA